MQENVRLHQIDVNAHILEWRLGLLGVSVAQRLERLGEWDWTDLFGEGVTGPGLGLGLGLGMGLGLGLDRGMAEWR